MSGLLYFTTGERTRKGRNLANDPRCTLGVSTDEFDLAVEGDAVLVDDPDVVADVAHRWASGGWPASPDESGTALTAEYSAPSAGPPPWRVYRLTPRQATVVLNAASRRRHPVAVLILGPSLCRRARLRACPRTSLSR